jgi:hypothetical protein
MKQVNHLPFTNFHSYQNQIVEKGDYFFKKLPFYLLALILISCSYKREKEKWNYMPFSPAAIEFNFINDPGATYFVNAEGATNIPSKGFETKTLEIVKQGKYFLDMEIDRPLKVRTNLGEQAYYVFVFPEDTTIINIEFTENGYEIAFSGLAKNINYYYLEKTIEFGHLDLLEPYELLRYLSSSSDHPQLMEQIDSITDQEFSFLENYKSPGKLSNLFQNYERAEIFYNGLMCKMDAIDGYKRRTKNYELSSSTLDDFLHYVNNDHAIFSERYFEFIDAYMVRKYHMEFEKGPPWHIRLKKYISNAMGMAKNELSGKTLEIYKLDQFSRLVQYYSDPAKIDSIIQLYKISNYKKLMKIAGTLDEEGRKIITLKVGYPTPDFYISNDTGDLISIRDYEDKCLILRFHDIYDDTTDKDNHELENTVQKYRDDNQIEILNICLGCDYEEWQRNIKKHKLLGNNLIAEAMWENILSDYFNIDILPHYTLLGTGNVFYQNITDVSYAKNDIDSLLKDYSN